MVKLVFIMFCVWGAFTGASAQGFPKESLREDLLTSLSFFYFLNRVTTPELADLGFVGISINNSSAQSLLPECTAEDMNHTLAENEEVQHTAFARIIEVARSKGIEKEVNFQMLARLVPSASTEAALTIALKNLKAEGSIWRSHLGEIAIPLTVQLDSNMNGQRQPFRFINLVAVPLISTDKQFSGFRLFVEVQQGLKAVGSVTFKNNNQQSSFTDRSLFIHIIDYELGLRVERLIGIKARLNSQIPAGIPN